MGDTQREGHVKMDAEGPPEAGRGRKESSLEPSDTFVFGLPASRTVRE